MNDKACERLRALKTGVAATSACLQTGILLDIQWRDVQASENVHFAATETPRLSNSPFITKDFTLNKDACC